MLFKHFKPETDPLMVGVQESTMLMLDSAHDVHPGRPWVITCGLRTPEKNCTLAGAVPNSAHESGLAVDMACDDDTLLFEMVDGLLHAGFTRVGVYLVRDPNDKTKFKPRHVHADNDDSKPQGVIWHYAEQN